MSFSNEALKNLNRLVFVGSIIGVGKTYGRFEAQHPELIDHSTIDPSVVPGSSAIEEKLGQYNFFSSPAEWGSEEYVALFRWLTLVSIILGLVQAGIEGHANRKRGGA